ncbi:alcohol acetyltransferase domain-containing protein [Hirsutella rhossiliensis]|uniref:Alcohol acetyltransferase domain-containing protein n=1 Tax=Hirsutella rhossiliensis TaxID=111463 RepID=A0A9P8SIB2_9HYPO|nr:alcohol acetyltransferase domain-containing protein [Hirsutella rhossiliensis]KAH0964008.1 alcohol acetyltransferase domain-containing protein [Hirsutella rhossiliensis]
MEEQPWTQDASPGDRRIVRRLGCIESYQVALQNLDHMRGNILACRYTLPARLVPHQLQHELVSTFETAVAHVVLKHPHMHVGLTGEGTDKPCWVRLDSINLQEHVEWHTVRGGTDHFQKAFLSASSQALDAKFINYHTAPGWKIKVLRQEGADFIEVLLVFNHTNMDGGSAKTFHKDLLQSLHDAPQIHDDHLTGNHVLTLPENSTAMLSPPPENLVSLPVEAGAMLEFLQVEVRTPAAKYPRSSAQAHWAPIVTAPFKTQFRSISVPSHVLSKLVQACHHRETTLTGLLQALVLVSLAALLEPSDATAFGSLTAMDFRRFLPSHHRWYPWFKPDRAMSNYVTCVNHIFDEDFVAQIRSRHSPYARDALEFGVLMDLAWTAARKVRHDLKAKLDQGTKNDMIGFAQAIGDWRTQLTEHTRRPRPSSWVITNLGLIDGSPTSLLSAGDAKPEPGSTWSMTRTQLLMCANVVSSAFGISVAAVKGGDLVITSSWQDCVIDVNLGEAFVKNLERSLKFTAQHQRGCRL